MEIKILETQLISSSKLALNSGQLQHLDVPKNPRFIKDDRFAKLKQSISDNPEMLALREVLAYKTTEGKLVVIGGNMRLRACKELKIKEIPTKVLPTETLPKHLRAYIIKDNVGFGSNDFELLANEWELDELEEFGMIVDFPEPDEHLEAKEDDYQEPDNLVVDVFKGDLITFHCEDGRTHRLLCGDSTSSDDVERLMDGKKADMVFTDPPYKIQTEGGFKGNIGESLKKQCKDIEFISEFEPSEFLNILPIVFNSKKINAYVFCNKDLLPDYLNWAIGANYSFNVLIWKKPSAVPIGGSHYPDIEYLLLFRKSAIWNGGLVGVNYSRCLEFNRETGLHPTMKPVELLGNELKISSNINSIVVDFFGGSGSTMVASEQLKRICYMMELTEKYCQTTINRIIKLDETIKVKINGKDYNQQ